MYLVKNAFRNVVRNKGRNILIGIIILIITTCTCIGLSINKAATNLVNTYKDTNPLEISFSLDMSHLRGASTEEKDEFKSLTVDDIKKYADSDLIKDYYYTLETSVSGVDIDAVDTNTRDNTDEDREESAGNKKFDKQGSIGDFRVTAYSDFSYLNDFVDGTKKIKEGKMIDKSSSENEVVISEDLADENDLSIDSSIILCLTDDESTTFTYKVVGIYEDNSDSNSSNFMNMNALNSSNQIYTNLSKVSEILEKSGTNDDDTKFVPNNGLSAKFHLKDNDSLEKFEKEVRNKGLSDYYTVSTNEDEILATLRPIKSLSSFSMNFLIVIIVIGIGVLSVINFLNIRDRKYEIGVLRAIGMSKFKVTLQLVLEILFVAIMSLILGTGIGVLTSQPVTNKMLENEIKSYQEQIENNQNNFGGEGFNKPSQDMMNRGIKGSKNKIQNIDYVDNLKVKIDLVIILELFAISLLVTASSAVVASVVINKYNPNKILQNRN